MKIRNGFVSNSSSSSFVLAFKKRPKTAADIREEIFGTETEYPNPYSHNDVTSFPVDPICEFLFASLKFTPLKIRKMMEDEIRGEISYSIAEVGKARVRGSSNSFYSTDDGYESSDVYSQRRIDDEKEKLKKHYPKVKWDVRFEAAIVAAAKNEQMEEAASKEMNEVEKKLREKFNMPSWQWKDTTAMSRQDASIYKKEERAYWEKQRKLIYNNPEYKTASKTLHSCYGFSSRNKNIVLIAKRLTDIFFSENKGKKIAQIEIEDHGSMGSAMEHGTLFDKIPHMRFSHH